MPGEDICDSGSPTGSDIDDELHFHLQTKMDDLIAAGMSPDEARREAQRQSLGTAAIVLTAAAIGASIAPAWHAAHLDPVGALRVQ